ncbi:MAG: hydantoinase/oxoprolinase family protein [Chloroflexi bacterium]|nr:hydantoinase/oxoprolinase family protein [Chloroflexota bacterium]
MPVRLGIDTGGTFTDLVGISEETGEIFTSKRPSTPSNPASAFLAVIDDARGHDSKGISTLIHGTTVATNCLLERKGANILLVTTEGFQDVSFIQRMNRRSHYDLQWEKPKPFVKRRNCVGVEERVSHKGQIVTPLTREKARDVARGIAEKVRKREIETIAVSFLFSYLNGANEVAMREALAEELPDVSVTLSHEVAPIWREYERTSTAMADAYIKPLVTRYIKSLEEDLRAEGILTTWSVMKSNGGIMEWHAVLNDPIHTLLSGPAGGMIASKFFGDISGFQNVITLDMGGTSADVGMIHEGELKYTTDFEVEFGIPIIVPTLDITTIGAGGGSIGWLDAGGLLHVGPESAGAEPGPACYGRGGTLATVSDANLVLGRLDPDYFLGGKMSLNLDLAKEAVEQVGTKLGMDVYRAAQAMIEIADENMADAIRLVSIQQGYDPRKFALVAFGGAGPVHAASIAEKLSIPYVIVPLHPGLCSAFGILMADLRVDKVWTRAFRSDSLDIETINTEFGQLKEQAAKELREQGYKGKPAISCSISMRYHRQNYEQQIELTSGEITLKALEEAFERFHEAHEKFYGYNIKGEVIELVNFNVTAIGPVPKPKLEELKEGPGPNPTSHRRVSFSKEGFVETPIYRRADLPAGATLKGPAVVEEVDSTTLVHPGQELKVNQYGIMILSTGGAQ